MATDSATKLPSESIPPPAPARPWLGTFFILLGSFLVMIAIVAFGVEYRLQHDWQAGFNEQVSRNLEQKAQMFASRVNSEPSARIGDITSQVGHDAGARATVIDASGTVIADSQAPARSLAVEGQQLEFRAALQGETAVETRSSNGIPVLYVAVPVTGGAVRLACPLADIEIARHKSDLMLLFGCLVALLAGVAISALAARTIARRLS